MAFIGQIKVRERGNTPRGMKKAFNLASKDSWADTAVEFHRNYRDKRFTLEHAREAGFAHRKGELLPRTTKEFRRSYTGRKLRLFGHTRALEFSGDTRRAVRAASITSTSRGGTASYRGARRFNFRHRKSKIRMSDEFKLITRRESNDLAVFYDRSLDSRLKEQDRK